MTREVAIDNAVKVTNPDPRSIWSAFTNAIAACPAVVSQSPLIAMFREWSEPTESPASCRLVALHAPPFNAWGVQFATCSANCGASPSKLVFSADKGAMCCLCTCCGWKSYRVKYDVVEPLVHGLSPDLPAVFWHAYPPSPHLLHTFARVTKDRKM